MRLEGQTKLARNVLVEIKRSLTQEKRKNNEFITLKEILDILRIHPEMLWYYPIPNTTGLFNLQGKNRLAVPYLNLGIVYPCFNQQNLLFEFNFDLNEEGVSLQTNNEYLRTKVYELIQELYTEKFYDRQCRYPMKILEAISFRNEYFREEIKKELALKWIDNASRRSKIPFYESIDENNVPSLKLTDDE